MIKKKPAWKTTEFWLSVLIIGLGLGTASGAVGDTGIVAKAIALGVGTLGGLGYLFVRTRIKVKEGSKKPGWKTSEFWLSFAALVVSGLMASGVVGDGSTFAEAIGLAAGLLNSLGYTVGRGAVKLPGDTGEAPATIVVTGDPDEFAKNLAETNIGAAGEPDFAIEK